MSGVDPDEARRRAVLALRDRQGGTLRCCGELHEIARGGRQWEEWWNPDGTRSNADTCPRWVAWAAEQPPAAPAMTLEAARDAAKAQGYRLVHESGLTNPAAMLACLLAFDALDPEDRGSVPVSLDGKRAEIARLRAFGVTPAVLS